MSKFFEALQRDAAFASRPKHRDAVAIRPLKLALVPTVQTISAEMARDERIYRLTEQFAAIASISNDSRLFVAGCAPGDGVSTVTVALALDISQRLGLVTALVDAHLQHPGLHNFFLRNELGSGEGSLIRTTGLARLELLLNSLGQTTEQAIQQAEAVLPRYKAAVIDLGVVRLDPSLLKLVRPNDLVMLVARY
jgi:Mrp family chromosome partitioning ATPase